MVIIVLLRRDMLLLGHIPELLLVCLLQEQLVQSVCILGLLRPPSGLRLLLCDFVDTDVRPAVVIV